MKVINTRATPYEVYLRVGHEKKMFKFWPHEEQDLTDEEGMALFLRRPKRFKLTSSSGPSRVPETVGGLESALDDALSVGEHLSKENADLKKDLRVARMQLTKLRRKYEEEPDEDFS